MAANKRRKLSPLPGLKNISAFAARKQLMVSYETDESCSETNFRTDGTSINSEERQFFSIDSLVLNPVVSTQKFESEIGKELDQYSDDERTETVNVLENDESDEDFAEITSKRARERSFMHPPDHLWAHLTTVNLSQGNAERLEDGSLRIIIGPGERLVVLGEYGLSVVSGQITILGAVLSSSRTVHEVYAPSSHSLPAIRLLSSDSERAVILLHQSNSKLRSLKRLSPLFAGLWNNPSNSLNASGKEEPKPWRSNSNSFQILLSQDADPRMGCNPILSPPEWNELLSISVSERSKDGRASVTMICGPKSSGKSTYSRLLINRLLTVSQPQPTCSCVALLDLDPGQPEFSPPGQLSLLLLSKPSFGPPFSHPDGTKSGTKLVRAHSISAVSPASDPDFYMACAADLLSCYRSLQLANPLVINTPGWILGTGLELLTRLIKRARPTQVVYMSQSGPSEAVESLQAAAAPTSVSTLPSQPSENLSRTSAHLRTMQYMSYFHSDTLNPGNRVWRIDPVTSMAPFEVKYGGKTAGILGLMCLGEQPSTRMVRDAVNGSLVAVVVIEDVAAIYSSNDKKKIEDVTALLLDTAEGIPYFNPANGLSLDPGHSHTIGLAIVRGIDVKRQRLQLLTPIPLRSIKDIRASGKDIILVSGKLDTPGWAYLEALYENDSHFKKYDKLQESDGVTQNSGGEEEEKDNKIADGNRDHVHDSDITPWVELLQGDKGRAFGARVWRVRRDLGKAS